MGNVSNAKGLICEAFNHVRNKTILAKLQDVNRILKEYISLVSVGHDPIRICGECMLVRRTVK